MKDNTLSKKKCTCKEGMLNDSREMYCPGCGGINPNWINGHTLPKLSPSVSEKKEICYCHCHQTKHTQVLAKQLKLNKVMSCPHCSPQPLRVKEGWEKEFDEKWAKQGEDGFIGHNYARQSPRIKSFISKQIQLAVLEEREKRIKELKKIEATGKCLDIPKYIEYLTKEIK